MRKHTAFKLQLWWPPDATFRFSGRESDPRLTPDEWKLAAIEELRELLARVEAYQPPTPVAASEPKDPTR